MIVHGFQSANLRLELGHEGKLAILWLDVHNQRLNVINRAFFDDLEEVLKHLEAQSGLDLVLIRSAKTTGFLAGADLTEFARIASADEAEAISRAVRKSSLD